MVSRATAIFTFLDEVELSDFFEISRERSELELPPGSREPTGGRFCELRSLSAEPFGFENGAAEHPSYGNVDLSVELTAPCAPDSIVGSDSAIVCFVRYLGVARRRRSR